MSSPWQSCPHCQVMFQRDPGKDRCPGCGKPLRDSTPEDDSLWFYAHNRQKSGPVSLAAVRQLVSAGQLTPSDMVLQQGTSKWLKAVDVPGLFTPSGTVVDAVLPSELVHTLLVSPSENGVEEPAAASLIERTVPNDASSSAWQESAKPTVAGYEILEELGRGGMGVVYKARQLQLNRIVALKMILAGAHAGSKEQARFRSEAEAVAKLQHPNIVQIHEVGDSEGRPYFSLEFVGGGSLAEKLDGTPQLTRQTAELVATLAHAIQAAHQSGIIHRDLKPGNILLHLQGAQTAGFGTPKITDFGLAKQMDSAGEQTRSGAIMGSPCYMAPEQAAGKSREIGPAADVYALGAILYELLTGRPPFRGQTPMDTIFQVLTEEPLPPSRLQPKVPHDLETICLKCLQKEASKRYESAEALASDLELFLAGAPIKARPIGALERAGKWMRQRPAAAALLAVSACALFGVVVGSAWYNMQLNAALKHAREQRQEAERQRKAAQANADEARRQENLARASFQKRVQEIDTLITRLDGRLATVAQAQSLRAEFLQEFLKSCEKLLGENKNDPDVRRQTASVHRLIGDVLRETFDDYPTAEESYGKALPLQKKLVSEFPIIFVYQDELARTHNSRGKLYHIQKRFAEARTAYAEELQILEKLAGGSSSRYELRQRLCDCRYLMAEVLRVSGPPREAEKAFRQTLALQEKLVAEYPKRAEIHSDIGMTLRSLGLMQADSDPAGAQALLERSLASHRQATQLDPRSTMFRTRLQDTYTGALGLLKKRGRTEELTRLTESFRKEFPSGSADTEAGRRDLVVGVVAPEIEGEDLDGTRFKLSDYRGKVVVLDFWAHWCGWCRQMYPHERNLVQRMKDRPFALLGINCEDDRDEVKRVVEKEKLNWRNWWDGRWGRIACDWQIRGYPTIVVLDHKGVIRYRDVRGKSLDDAVDRLVKERESELRAQGQ